MMRWLLISMVAAQLLGCGPSYHDTQAGICHAEQKTLVDTYDEFSRSRGYACL